MTTTDTAEQLTPDQLRRQEHNRATARALRAFTRSVTQGEWLAVCRALDMTRDQIGSDDNWTLLALAWVKERREHGAASIDVLLELTDRGLMEFHGYQLEPHPDDVEPATAVDAGEQLDPDSDEAVHAVLAE